MGKYFGTDGIRGNVGTKLTPQLAFRVGEGTGKIFYREKKGTPTVVVGRDPRISSAMLESAMVAGLLSSGTNVILAGMVPTPTVAFLVKELGTDGGVMISASHNVFTDNGIKIFNAEGYKLPDEYEAEIEEFLDDQNPIIDGAPAPYGQIVERENTTERYIAYLASTVETKPVGLKVALDCSNGAASGTARQLYERIGVQPLIIHDKPNGVNINACCGSTHIETLAKFVVEQGCDVGIAFDGDSDRCIAVDEQGEEVDGDLILGVLALQAKRKGLLPQNRVVGTVMSNLGFLDSLQSAGIEMEITKVGDRFVLERMLETGLVYGGEASGHVILLEHITTGDGQLAGMKLLEALAEMQKPLSQVVREFAKTPSTLINLKVPGERKEEIIAAALLGEYVAAQEAALPKPGRILVRASGTEALVRILVECPNLETTQEVAENIKRFIEGNFK